MITSRSNEKLKLIRRLAERKHRDREGLFVAEGEDLIDAAEAAGAEVVFVLRAGEEVAEQLLGEVSLLGSGSRAIGVYRQRWARDAAEHPPATYLHGVGDPANVGAVVRSAHALVGGCVVVGPGSADPYSPKAVRASMGSVFVEPLVRAGVEATPTPRVAMVAHGGDPPDRAKQVATLCLGSERSGLPPEVIERCDWRWTIPLRPGGAESLNLAAAAAIALGRLSSAAAEARGDVDHA